MDVPTLEGYDRRMQQLDPSLWRYIHEASHGVVPWELGLAGPSAFEFKSSFSRAIQDGLEDWSIEEQIMSYMAGPASDNLFYPPNRQRRIRFGNEETGESDEEAVDRLIINFPYKEQSSRRGALMEKTIAILESRRNEIIQLARFMMGREYVDGAEAKAFYSSL